MGGRARLSATELFPVIATGPFDAKAMTSTNIPRLSAIDSSRLNANFMGVITHDQHLACQCQLGPPPGKLAGPLAFREAYATLVGLIPSRYTWAMSLALAVFIVVSMQGRALDIADTGPSSSEDDVAFSAWDDALINPAVVDISEPTPAPARALDFPAVSPRGRLVVSEPFRPPIRPSA